MRLFVAVTPPPEAVAELSSATEAVRAAHPRLRWTRPDQWHLTLAFLGTVGDEARAGLVDRLARAAALHPPMRLALTGAGRFGDRVLWTRVTGDVAALRGLAAAARVAATRVGIAVEERPYRPHLTLARGRDGADLRPVVDALAGFAGCTWTATQLHLVRSHLGAGPDRTSRYETLNSWPLTGS
ncbi:MAG TPA: RNA 2',3'-cyclic phosphodiesterase [Pseudonocardia sp.]|jgi:2'-5' RNA ligase|uniref:RNA 2',3'-cyclic phosphodiesterase n=1 Tax=Pseudonocardia sp. TaxID=60912 RepID=UPI002B4B36B0|nr:RNA 2',3'-cyclic phosphodiesterase [Pseudonocardia sp.]HLU58156.1 RNA 2',3'-cyclic phosphodiesterase [Pseudonocardia sp.]